MKPMIQMKSERLLNTTKAMSRGSGDSGRRRKSSSKEMTVLFNTFRISMELPFETLELPFEMLELPLKTLETISSVLFATTLFDQASTFV
ncbi:MAG: hypothetical protein FJ333_05780 [Sphingomonadales bacterium]|nr:hypothetical protein [Sphingomonadales bacterium]